MLYITSIANPTRSPPSKIQTKKFHMTYPQEVIVIFTLTLVYVVINQTINSTIG